MQEKSLESTDSLKIFWGSIPPYPPSVARHRRSLFHSKNFMSPNPLEWNPATGFGWDMEYSREYFNKKKLL